MNISRRVPWVIRKFPRAFALFSNERSFYDYPVLDEKLGLESDNLRENFTLMSKTLMSKTN